MSVNKLKLTLTNDRMGAVIPDSFFKDHARKASRDMSGFMLFVGSYNGLEAAEKRYHELLSELQNIWTVELHSSKIYEMACTKRGVL